MKNIGPMLAGGAVFAMVWFAFSANSSPENRKTGFNPAYTLAQALNSEAGTAEAQKMVVTQTFLSQANRQWYPEDMHVGVDYSCNLEDPVYSEEEGTAIFVGMTETGFGNAVIIKGDRTSLYGHLNSFNVKVGDTIKKGTRLGGCGTTGFSTGTHLHKACRVDGVYMDCEDADRNYENYRSKAIQACWDTGRTSCHDAFELSKKYDVDYFTLVVYNPSEPGAKELQEAESQGYFSVYVQAEKLGFSKDWMNSERKILFRNFLKGLVGEVKCYVELANHSPQQNEYINYAYQISGCNENFAYLIKSENGEISPTTKHQWDGPSTQGWGFCGITSPFHNNIINDERFFTNWQWQMEKCWELYSGGTTFYSINNYTRELIPAYNSIKKDFKFFK